MPRDVTLTNVNEVIIKGKLKKNHGKISSFGIFLFTLHREIDKRKIFNLKNITIMSEIANRVTDIITDKLGLDKEQVTETASFTTDLGADSLDTVELIMEFEKEFNLEIPDEDAQKIKTVKDAVDYIEAHQA